LLCFCWHLYLFFFNFTDILINSFINDTDKKPIAKYLIYFATGGLLGGSIYGMKYFYRVIARRYWTQDRRYWRILSPFISMAIAFVIGCMIYAGILNSGKPDSGFKNSWGVAFGFFAGYFADEAVGKMYDIATMIFGKTKKLELENIMNIKSINDVVFAERNKPITLSNEEVKPQKIGAKAYGLSIIPTSWSLPFFIISSDMFKEYYQIKKDINKIKDIWISSISNAAGQVSISKNSYVYLRSNLCNEGLDDRGEYESYECFFSEIFDKIKMYYDSIIDKFSNNCPEVPLLIQQYAQSFGKGHITNEIRVSQYKTYWKGETETQNTYYFKINIRSGRKILIPENIIQNKLYLSNLKNIKQVLEMPCKYFSTESTRFHIEWLFDGKNIFFGSSR